MLVSRRPKPSVAIAAHRLTTTRSHRPAAAHAWSQPRQSTQSAPAPRCVPGRATSEMIAADSPPCMAASFLRRQRPPRRARSDQEACFPGPPPPAADSLLCKYRPPACDQPVCSSSSSRPFAPTYNMRGNIAVDRPVSTQTQQLWARALLAVGIRRVSRGWLPLAQTTRSGGRGVTSVRGAGRGFGCPRGHSSSSCVCRGRKKKDVVSSMRKVRRSCSSKRPIRSPRPLGRAGYASPRCFLEWSRLARNHIAALVRLEPTSTHRPSLA